MGAPASHYGDLNERNPVVVALRREVKSLMSLMKRPDGGATVKGVKLLVDIWKQFKHRLPAKFYQEQMLQIADFLSEIKMYEVALWQGYSLHLKQFSSEEITDIRDLEHFKGCFFPEGLDVDQDVLSMKVRAMLGCALCTFELEKKHSDRTQKGLCKILKLLSFVRIMMQAFQLRDHFYWHIYNGSSLIYNICRYLMTINCSAEALEYLLWASINVELCVPLMTAKYLPLSVTLYCAVCHCYYDNQAAPQAEKFARRALGKINKQAKEDTTTSIEAQRAYKEASIKLGVLVFKRAVFESRRPQDKTRIQTKSSLKDFMTRGPWPRTPTEKLLMSMFDSYAGQFLAILEALWDSSTRPLQMRMLGDAELQETALELLSAGICILSGSVGAAEQKCEEHLALNPIILTSTSTLTELALTGEKKIPIISAVRFLKLLFQYKQLDVFADLAKQMLHLLSGVKGQPFRKAESELALLHSYSILFFQKSQPRDDISEVTPKSSSFSSDEISPLVNTLQTSICGSDPELHPNVDLVLDVVLFLWSQVKVVIQNDQLQATEFSQCEQKTNSYHKWLWCLSVLCEVALACQLGTVDSIMTAEMICTLAAQLEKASEHFSSGRGPVFGSAEMAAAELLQKVLDMVKKGLESLSKGISALITQDLSAVTDSAFLQKPGPLEPPSASAQEIKRTKNTEDVESEVESSCKPSTSVFLLARDLHLELEIIFHRVSVKLLHLHAVEKPELMDWIKDNKVSKVLFLIQRALLEHNAEIRIDSNTTKTLLEEAFSLMEKAEQEERKVYMTLNQSRQKPYQVGNASKQKGESPPPPPVLVSRTDHTFAFAPAPYDLEEQVCWYQLFGRVAEGINKKVRLNDCSLPGTGLMVQMGSGECVMRVEGLQPNQKYVFAVAAYDSQGNLLGKSIGQTTAPLLASIPVQLLATWAHLAQVAFKTKEFAAAKRACRELWKHYTDSSSKLNSPRDRLAVTSLHEATIQQSSPHLCSLVLTTIFIKTEISIQEGALCCETLSDSSPFIWDQEARLAECDRMLVAMDLALCLNDGSSAVQAVVTCYGVLAPLIFHQIVHDRVAQVLQKCLVVLEENSSLLVDTWAGATAESLLYMTACITFYLSKALRLLSNYQLAAAVLDRGRRLLQEATDAQLQMRKLSRKATAMGADGTASASVMIQQQFQVLNIKTSRSMCEAELTSDNCPPALTGTQNTIGLWDLIYNNPLQEAHQEVMKIKWRPYFLEFAARFLQRTLEEGHPDLVLKWGEIILQFLFKRDDKIGLPSKHLEVKNKNTGGGQAPKEMDIPQQKKMPAPPDELRKMLKTKLPSTMMRHVRTHRELCTVDKLLTMMSDVVRCSKERPRLRNLCSRERPWRCQVHRCMAQAHLAAVYQDLETHQQRLSYSQFDPLYFSLAFTGFLIKRNLQRQPSSRCDSESKTSSSPSDLREQEEKRERKVVRLDEERCGEGGSFSPTGDKPSTTSSLNSLKLAASHLRRAMVLAHRGGHWTLLLCVCQTVWDHSCKTTVTSQLEAPPPVTEDQLHSIFTPLLVLATDLLMDMLNKLELWSLYDRDLTKEELESSVHFSAPLDDSTQVDLRWVRTLVLHTLERLYGCEKWERLAHFALLFNSYTRERYALIVAPLLLHAQRSLIERIHSVGGPAVPQPHHIKTQKSTGKEVTNRSYFHCQLLCGWSPELKLPIKEETSHTNIFPRDEASLKAAEKQRSLSLVCVPLDVEDTLSCYHRALQETPYGLQALQHSHSLLLLLLTNTQPYMAQVRPTPNNRPCDPSKEDFTTPNAILGLPVRPDSISAVIAAYSNSIQCLTTGGHESLRLLALHEIGNLHFYAGNMKAAQSSWIQAVDCSLQSSGVLQKWDGVSFGGGSMQKTVKQAGVWGCLQAAVITAKIAQFILKSDVNQRTKCCLLSSHLFKCVLCCSVAQPQLDLQYASHTIREELLPGVDLFSEPRRLHVSSVVSGLHFVCDWLFMTGNHITLLPILALYIHFVGPVCRDVRRTAEGKILKVRVLTELCLFSEAVMEIIQLTQGTGIFLPCGPFIAKTKLQPMTTFYNNKSLLDNKEAVEALMNCDIAHEIQTLYGPTVCASFNLARVQLVLALSKTLGDLPDPDPKESCAATTSCYVESESCEQEKPNENPEPPKPFTFCHEGRQLTSERIKVVLLEAASSLLTTTTEQLTLMPCSEEEKLELTLVSNLLKANLHLQQECPKLSFDIAVSSLVLLQTSPVILRRSCSELTEDPGCPVTDSQLIDCPAAAEAAERIGPSLWLRCRLALVQSLVASIQANASILPGKNINNEMARLLQKGIEECIQWGDRDTQALLLVESAELKARRGKTAESVAALQEAVGLLSERTVMPPGSMLTLARATLLLSDIQELQSSTLLQVKRKLLDMQMCLFGQCVTLVDDKMGVSTPGSGNIYMNMLKEITLRIDSMEKQQATAKMNSETD